MKVWAHRGFSSIYPENTMLAFERTLESGAYGIEMDVHLSSDGKPVVIHDENLLRTCGIDRAVGETTFDELTRTVASKTQNDRFNAKIPSFEEFCSFIKENSIMANIEIKTGIVYYPVIEEKVVELVEKYKIEDKVLFSSFNWLSVVKCRRLLPSVPCGLLFDRTADIRHIAYEAKSLGIEYLHPDYECIDDEMVEECRALSVGINAWTINDERKLERLKRWNIEGCITNSPDIALKALNFL